MLLAMTAAVRGIARGTMYTSAQELNYSYQYYRLIDVKAFYVGLVARGKSS